MKRKIYLTFRSICVIIDTMREQELTAVYWQERYAELENIYSELKSSYLELSTSNAAYEKKIGELLTRLQWLEDQIHNLGRRKYGTSSERSDVNYDQLSMYGEPEIVPPPEPEYEEINYKRKKQAGKREEDLSGLPVERIDHELPESERICPECGETMSDIGVETKRELKYIPARLVVVEHARHSYACRKCKNNSDVTPIFRASMPTSLLPGSLASASLVAHIIVQKYMYGLPLYRIEKGFIYDGASVSRQTMASWVIKVNEMYLWGIYVRLKEFLLNGTVAHADETTFQVLNEPGRAAETKSYVWVYRTGGCSEQSVVIYEYTETRKQEHPKAFLSGFTGYLHTDGYQVYHNLPPGITVVGCWAHVRRGFETILKKLPKDDRNGSSAEIGMAYINALFDFERQFAELTPEERRLKRLEFSKPVADNFFTWAKNLGVLPKSEIGQAANYALNQREYLENVWLDGRTDISNNRCERSVKPFVMGRKAWLFADSTAGALASTVMYSIIETAKENGLHPERYIEFLLETLPDCASGDIDLLLPWSSSLPERCKAPAKTNS